MPGRRCSRGVVVSMESAGRKMLSLKPELPPILEAERQRSGQDAESTTKPIAGYWLGALSSRLATAASSGSTGYTNRNCLGIVYRSVQDQAMPSRAPSFADLLRIAPRQWVNHWLRRDPRISFKIRHSDGRIGRNSGLKEKLIALSLGADCKLRRLRPPPPGRALHP